MLCGVPSLHHHHHHHDHWIKFPLPTPPLILTVKNRKIRYYSTTSSVQLPKTNTHHPQGRQYGAAEVRVRVYAKKKVVHR